MTDERKAELRGLEPREPMTHELKCWPEYYAAIERGEKTFEIRKFDRPYRVGDTLLLKEYDPDKRDYTGKEITRVITYILSMDYLPSDNIPHFAGYVALGLAPAVPGQSSLTAEERALLVEIKELEQKATPGPRNWR